LNLRSFDLNLLVIFQAIATHGSVIGASEQVGLSPSAVSHALARLRAMFNDELFYRSSNGLQPTQRALEICKEIALGLSHISNAIESQNSFEPSEDDRSFTIQVSEYVQEFLVPRLIGFLRRTAPRIAVQITPCAGGAGGIEAAVDVQIRPPSEEIDPATMQTRPLATDRFMVVMNANHHATRASMDAELFASLDHVVVSQTPTCTSAVDEALRRRGLRRRVAMSVPNAQELPDIVAQTDLVAIVPYRRLADDGRFSRLAITPMPLDDVEFALALHWDGRRDREPANRWLRQVIARIFAEDLLSAQREPHRLRAVSQLAYTTTEQTAAV
jgi:DNA-binding transcriptional LysR family regulator